MANSPTTNLISDDISMPPLLTFDSNDSTLAPMSPPVEDIMKQAFPTVIPPEHAFRTLVLCFDGTGDQFDTDNSNIVELFTVLKKDDRSKQMVYYQAGIGTWTSPQIATPMMAKISKTMDEAIAWNLDAHVMGGYEFLMQNYSAGDRICIFGFSRGAYTARSLAGMIHKVGLLPACNHQQVPFAYKMYTRKDEVGWKQSNAFKRAFSVDVDIEFIGVWDTVNSVGLIPRRLPFTTSNTIVRTFRHAVALDERRVKFKANHWNRPNDKEQMLSVSDQKLKKKEGKKAHPQKKHSLKAFEQRYRRSLSEPTDVEEVWFAGCHCDVGGGSVSNDTKHSLARIPLRWMIRECFKTNSGIMFDVKGLRKLGLDHEYLYPIVLPRPPALPVESVFIQNIPKAPAAGTALDSAEAGDPAVVSSVMTEQEWDLRDALSPIYDQLDLAWFWWILEYLPLRTHHQKDDNSWKTKYEFNRGHGRKIPKQRKNGVRVHRSVKTRMEAQYENGQKYHSKAVFDLEHTIWVD